MSELVAKPIVKNKLWVVEDSGKKVATILATHDGGYVYVHDNSRELFPSVKNLSKKYSIKFSNKKPSSTATKDNKVYGFPAKGQTHNQVYNVQKKIPMYTKTSKSRSFYCAGHYLIQLNNEWEYSFCPKSITLSRYSFMGPFKTEQEAKDRLKDHICTI